MRAGEAALAKTSSKMRWWKKKAVKVFVDEFADRCRGEAFDVARVTDYVSTNMKEIDESDEGFFSSEED